MAPILFGRLAQPVLADELSWTVDTNREARSTELERNVDGQRVLCIELPKKPYPSGTGSGARCDCVFDESLHIHGKPVLLPGLSQGTITITLPDELRKELTGEA